MPVLFVGHGSPMNIVEDNAWSRGFSHLSALVPKPRAIVAVSAHWFVPGVRVTAANRPETIHDFYGFPPELYVIDYPAPGDPALARHVVELLGDKRAALDSEWGLDHGAWSVLRHMFPAADFPVVQLGIDSDLSPTVHFKLGRALAPLRNEGVLLLASGNIVHNLRYTFTHLDDPTTPDWAADFDNDIARAVQEHDDDFLIRAISSDSGRMAHPTPDHYLPLLYAAGAADNTDSISFPITGFDLGSLSMRAVLFR